MKRILIDFILWLVLYYLQLVWDRKWKKLNIDHGLDKLIYPLYHNYQSVYNDKELIGLIDNQKNVKNEITNLSLVPFYNKSIMGHAVPDIDFDSLFIYLNDYKYTY